jgi:hypothetical protein
VWISKHWQAPSPERGWRLYLTVDEDEPAEAVIYCPICAEREFGEPENAGPL